MISILRIKSTRYPLMLKHLSFSRVFHFDAKCLKCDHYQKGKLLKKSPDLSLTFNIYNIIVITFFF